jgi:asparaginyl-tRNA synthetase
MNCVESYVQYLYNWLLKLYQEETGFMVKSHDKAAMERLDLVSSTPFKGISYTKTVKDADRKFENTVQWGIVLASEHERYGVKIDIYILFVIFSLFGFEIISCN